MTKQRDTTPGMRYSPQTEEAHMLRAMLLNYEEAFEKANNLQKALNEWALGFIDVKVGDIVLQNKRHGKTTGFVATFDMRGTFGGWKGHTPRMRVEKIYAVDNALIGRALIQICIKGVPLKDDGTPFKDARCSAVLDLTSQAMDSDRGAPDGYNGYLFDALARYVDGKVAEEQASGTVGAPKQPAAPVGSRAWLAGFSAEQQEYLKAFVQAKLPAKVVSADGVYEVMFAGTKIVIARFTEAQDAEAYVKAWHDACAAEGQPAGA